MISYLSSVFDYYSNITSPQSHGFVRGPAPGDAPEATAIRGYVTVKGGDVPTFDFTSGSWVVTSEGSSVVARRAAEEGCAGCRVA